MNRIVGSAQCFREALRQTSNQPGRVYEWPVGINRVKGNEEIILIPLELNHGRSLRHIRLVISEILTPPRRVAADPTALLIVDNDTCRGAIVGFRVLNSTTFEPMNHLYLVGPGLHQVPLSPSGIQPNSNHLVPPPRLSRTIGALGQDAWKRIAGLRYVIVGAGRTGSLLARLLLQLGIRHLSLIDFDEVQESNLGEMADFVGGENIGKHKVEAIMKKLLAMYPEAEVNAVRTSISNLAALHAVKQSDVLFCCSDHDTARLVTTLVASMYCRVLIDTASGISRESDSRMGVSIRLALPSRCLCCLGGLRLEGTWSWLDTSEQEFHVERIWTQERQGSLASISNLSASLAVRCLEDLVLERLSESIWLQGEFSNGRLQVSYPTSRRDASECPICSRIAGRGDDALGEVPAIIQELCQ
jgi:hypothetical protein